MEFLKLQEKLFQKSVTFISLDLPYSTGLCKAAVNKLIATNLAAIATFETERRKERQREGIEAARKTGKYLGRKTVITPKLISEVQDLKEKKNLSITQIAKVTGRGRNTIYKILKVCSIQSISKKHESENFQIHYLTLNLQFDNLKQLIICRMLLILIVF